MKLEKDLKMVKKLVNLSSSDIEYVEGIAKQLSDPRAKKGDFGKGLRKIIEDHKNAKNKEH